MFQFPRFPPRPYAFRARSGGLTTRDCSIRAPSVPRVAAAPRGVSPLARALHRPCRPGHPPRAHPCSHPRRAARTRAHAGQEPAPHPGAITHRPATLAVQHSFEHSLVKVRKDLSRGGEWWCAPCRCLGRAGSRHRTTPPRSPSPRPWPRVAGVLGAGSGAVRAPARSTWVGARSSPSPGRARLPRKEVIQPQLPLRLPCYDFVPVTRPTLGRWPPEGSPRGLQVSPAPMT